MAALLGLLFTLSSLNLVAAPANKVREYTLDNGLQVLVLEDHRAPVVVSQVWYRVGSSYESNGTTGVSHVLEHMMFKGTESLGPNEFSQIIAANGGRENAFTGRDYTAYFQTMHKDRFEISFKLEADRMRNLSLPAEEFAKEVQVVMEERRLRTEDKPTALTYEQFQAAAYQTSPYHHPVIGWMADLKSMNIEDLRDWYIKWYTPANATLVVVGDVKADEVHRLAKKYFGPLKGPAAAVVKPQREVKQRGERRIKVKAPAEVPYLIMGYKVPVLKTAADPDEAYALEVLGAVLDGGNSARLARELVRGRQIAVSAGAGYSLYDRMDSLFLFDGAPATGHSIEELEAAIREQIQRVRDHPVDKAELDRIKAQVVAGKVYERDSVFYQGMQIGTLVTVGLDYRQLDEYVDRIRAITPAQVQAVAKKYLIDDTLTVAILEPQNGKSKARAKGEVQ
ncbi:M16 family metallopeptidase [Sulfuriflexus mobilis]|uniref:M16 family metallopeptidase n=1 Tax=Sulfuriflexus mobilis TaxID=1811807 RepID=UPI003B8459AA